MKLILLLLWLTTCVGFAFVGYKLDDLARLIQGLDNERRDREKAQSKVTAQWWVDAQTAIRRNKEREAKERGLPEA